MRKLASIILFLVIVSNSFGQSKNSPLQISHLTGDFYVYKTFHDYKNKIELIGFGAKIMKYLGLEKRLFR